jgi:hypothetical protein
MLQLSITVCQPILEIWLIEWFILLCWANDDNDIEILELPLQCIHPAKSIPCTTSPLPSPRMQSSVHNNKHNTGNIVTCWRQQLPFQEASPSRRWKQPTSPHCWRGSPGTQPNPIKALPIHRYTHSTISGLERVPEKATGNWGGTGW